LLDIQNLKTYFYTEDGIVKAVDGVDFSVYPGEVMGLVGESGCGKSVTSLSIMRLIGIPGKVVDGEIFFEGKNLLKLSEAEMVDMRGNRISMIFQQPQSSLNPVFKVADQVSEVLQIHQNMGREESWEKAVDLLRLVGIPDPEEKAHSYPHEMSGGQAQRVMIAMALALNPQLLWLWHSIHNYSWQMSQQLHWM
jgi:ABC-type dipeptide/oligopeptide/nickel transport system ATPase component